ncbi:MAG: hypothetical protein JWM27_3190, partial [Gemmatimonadetes bacterium]|nr:hypothetical protein [Gemmatimonadota bacterium]
DACARFAAASPRAALQRRLEMELRDFESRYARMTAASAPAN